MTDKIQQTQRVKSFTSALELTTIMQLISSIIQRLITEGYMQCC